MAHGRLAWGTGLFALALAAVTPACEPPPGVPIGNLPPETYLSISDADVDTTFYELELSWWGSDADGEIDRYEYRWDRAWTPLPGDTTTTDGEEWVVTRTSNRAFTMLVMDTLASPTFFVRAIDDAGAVDPTPIVQTFHVRNRLPRVTFGSDLTRPVRSLPAVTFSLVGTDPDGNDTVRGYRSWFEGQDPETESRFFPGGDSVHVTIGPADFPAGATTVTIHFQAFDETNTFGTARASHTWDVLDATGRSTLLVDQSPSTSQFDAQVDAFYAAHLDTVVGMDDIVLLKIDTDGAFRSTDEVEAVLPAFDRVFWYTGIQQSGQGGRIALLSVAAAGIESYVRAGGRMYLETTFAVGSGVTPNEGSFAPAFTATQRAEFFGIQRMFFTAAGNTNHVLLPTAKITGNTPLGLDSLRALSVASYVDFFELPTDATPLAWAEAGDLVSPNNPEDYHGAYERAFPGGGQLTYLSFPIARMDGYGTAGRFFQIIAARLAEVPPPPRRPGPLTNN